MTHSGQIASGRECYAVIYKQTEGYKEFWDVVWLFQVKPSTETINSFPPRYLSMLMDKIMLSYGILKKEMLF